MNQKATLFTHLLIGVLLSWMPYDLFAQAKQPFCQDLLIRDFTDKHGKKLADPALTDDTESLFAQLAACKILLRHRYPDILVALKNDHLVRQTSSNTCIYRISDDLSQKLKEQGIFYLLSGCVEPFAVGENEKVRVFFQIEQLMDRSISYEGVLEMPRSTYQHRGERKEKLRIFIEKEILRLPPPPSNVPIYGYSAGVVAGAGITYLSLSTAAQIQKDWVDYHALHPTDPKNSYPENNRKYIENQYIAIGGGVLSLVCGALLVHKLTYKRSFSARRRYSADVLFDVQKGWQPFVSNHGIGVTWRF
ncbi:MAG: hypothetical protein RLZZ628_746 [Bacteroidota bacterium]|jgi:hypothetical protein